MGKPNKTKPEAQDVDDFLARVESDKRRADAQALCELFKEATDAKPQMWGSSMVGFGTHHYVYASGREGDTMAIGFAPRKAALVIYGLKFYDKNAEAVARLGPVTTGKGCVYVKDLDQIDLPALKKLARSAYQASANA